jgi:hypothetical protein
VRENAPALHRTLRDIDDAGEQLSGGTGEGNFLGAGHGVPFLSVLVLAGDGWLDDDGAAHRTVPYKVSDAVVRA